MNLITKYIKPYMRFAIGAPLLMLLEVFMDLMQPTLMARIVDKGIIPTDMNVLTETGLLMLGITVIGLIGGIGCSITSAYASTGLAKDLREALYKKVLSLSHKNIDSIETGHIITIMTNDVVQVENMVRFGMRIMVRAPLQIVGSLILALMISPVLSSIFLLLIPLIILTIYFIMKQSNPLFKLVQKRMDRLNIHLQENLSGIRLVKAFVRQNHEKEKFSMANDELIEVNLKASRILSYAHPIMMTFLNMGVLAVLWFGSRQVWADNLMIGQVIAFINYMMQLLMSLIMVSQILMNLSRAQASLSRLDNLLSQEADIRESSFPLLETGLRGEIEFRNVSFSYDLHSPDPVLKDISFKINAGEKIALLGATGSGKSTLASLIPRLYDATSGEILMDGINIKNLPLQKLRNGIGMAPQQTILFSGSIKDNIIYGNRSYKGNAEEFAAKASLNSFIETLPEQYDSEVKQRGVNFSGGQKQRIAIARALWAKPPILILDDSTSAVDTKTAENIQKVLFEESGRTVLIITQRISSTVNADKILLLEDGKLAGIGKHQELIRENEIYREIYQSQNRKEVVLS